MKHDENGVPMQCALCANWKNGKCQVKYYVQETDAAHECDEPMTVIIDEDVWYFKSKEEL